MIRETIRREMKKRGITQRKMCQDTGIEYTALNTFLNNRKGLRYCRIQQVLDYLGLDAVCHCSIGERRTIQKAVWLELRTGVKGIRPTADELGKSYDSLHDFAVGRSGLPIDCVEHLMGILNIKLEPYRD